MVGCAALRIYSAERRRVGALAVAADVQGGGIGGRLVETLLHDAQLLGLRRVFALTTSDGSFIGSASHDARRRVPGEGGCGLHHVHASRACTRSPWTPCFALTFTKEEEPWPSPSCWHTPADSTRPSSCRGCGRTTRTRKSSAWRRTSARARSCGTRAPRAPAGRSALVVEDLRESVRARGHLADAARRRDLRAQVPARHVHGAADHRAQPGAAGVKARRGGARARLHGEGQRPGALRADVRRVRAAPEGHRAVARVGHPLARGRHQLRGARGIDVPVTKAKIYSRDRNLWHVSHEGGPLEDPGTSRRPTCSCSRASPEPRRTVRSTSRSASRRATRSRGRRGAVARALVETLNEMGGMHGVGRADIVEDRWSA
jgi:hypothetical protein